MKIQITEIKDVPFRMGSRVRLQDNEYIVASVGEGCFLLVNIITGARWGSPVKVKDLSDISQAELAAMVNDLDVRKVSILVRNEWIEILLNKA
jgi:hypothetical protein